MSRNPALQTRRTDAAPPRRVSHRHDATERQADRAANIVARGGSVTGWSFASVPAEASVHREEEEEKKKPPPETPAKLEDKPKSESEAYAEAGGKVVEGLLKTKVGQQVQDRVTSSKPLTGAIGVGMLAAGKEVPIPLGKGVTLGVKVDGLTEGKVNSAGVTLTFGGGTPKKTAATPVIDRDSAKLMESIRAQSEGRGRQKPVIRPLWVPKSVPQLPATTPGGPGWRFDPLVPGASIPGVHPEPQPPQPEEIKKEDEVQRAPATTSEAPSAQEHDTSGVPAATRGGGRALEPALRHSMEARFGYDFSSVRLHDDPTAASAAASVEAAAFTVGEHIVFGSGRFDPSSPEGRHLLAHELAHVVQQRAGAATRATGAPTRIQRRGWWESFLIWAGVSEGTWLDAELRGYLTQLTARRSIEGAYDSDNKARALVDRWKKNPVTWALRADQKALLIDEMIDGPTLDADEDAILDILEGSEADDLRWIFFGAAARYDALKSNLHGAQDDRLDAFVAARFLGGAAALRRGEVAVTGPPVVGAAATFAMNNEYIEARIRDEESSAAEILALVERSTPKDRRRVFDYLWRTTWPATLREAGQVARSAAGATGDRKDQFEERLVGLRKRVRTLNVLLGRFFAEKLPGTAVDLEASTRALTKKAAEEAKEALIPKVHEPLPEDRAPDEDPADADTPDTPDAADAETGDKDSQASPPPGDARDAKDDAKREAERKRKAARRREKKFGEKSAYRRAMEKALRKVITDQYRSYVLKAGTRVAHTEIARIADVAREETRAVLGRFFDVGEKDLTGDTVAGGGNVHSWYEARGEELKAMAKVGPERLREAAIERIMDHYSSRSSLRSVNGKYSAAPAFKDGAGTNVEGRTLVAIARDVTVDGPSADGLDKPVTIVDKLNATYRSWGGVRRGSQVYVNLFEEGDQKQDRLARWDKLRTLVHEYIHTLRHDDYTTFADSFGDDSRERHTLVEAVDELFTGIVWAHMAPRLAKPEVRAKVEGARYAQLPPLTVPDPHHYESLAEAMALVRKVGVANVAAAYFLGLVDRIGGPSRAATRGRPSGTRSGAKAGAKPRGGGRGTTRRKGAKK